MSEVILSNANSPYNMRAKVTYTAGNGSISITKVEGYRTDGYSTTEYGASNGYVYVTIGGTSTSQKRTSVNFNANSSASTIWDAGATKNNLSGNTSISVTFSGYSNTNINNASFSTTLYAGYANPSLTINNSSHVLSVPSNTTDAGCTIPVSIGNTGGRTCTLKVNGAIYSSSISSDNSSYNIVLKKADTPAAAHNVQTIVQNHTDASTFTIPIELYVGSLSSGVKYATIVLNDNIKPSCTLNLSGSVGIEDTNGNAMTALNGIHVAGLTKPTFTFTTTGIYGSTINTNKTLSITSGTASAAMTVTTSPATWTSAFNGVQTRTATLTCTDSRGRPGTSSGVSIALQDYDAPTVTPTITRCTSNGTTSATGHYAKMSFSITKSPLIKNSSDINTFTLKYSIDNKATWTNVTVSGSNGTYTASTGAFGGGNFAEESAYTLYYMYEDIYKKGQVVPITLDPATTLISRHTGGDGVTLGRVATSSGFHNYLASEFHAATTFTGTVQCDGNANFTGSVTKNGTDILQPAYDKIGTLSDLTTTAKTDTVSAINELAGGVSKLRSYICLDLSSRYNTSFGGWSNHKINLNRKVISKGNLTLANNGVCIGAGISTVLILGVISLSGSNGGELDIKLFKGTSNSIGSSIAWNVSYCTGVLQSNAAMAIVNVSQNDYIYLACSAGYNQQYTFYEEGNRLIVIGID